MSETDRQSSDRQTAVCRWPRFCGAHMKPRPAIAALIGCCMIAGGGAAEKTPRERVDSLVTQMHTVNDPTRALIMLEELESSLELDPTLQKRLNVQRDKYKALVADQKVKIAGTWGSADDLRAAVESYNSKIAEGLQALTQKDGDAALKAFEAAVRVYPEGIRARFILGMGFSSRGSYNPQKSLKHFESVLDRSPKYHPAVNNLAITQFRLGNHAEAYALWKRLLAEDPEFPEAVHNVKRIAIEAQAGRIRFAGASKVRQKGGSRAELFEELANSVSGQSRTGLALHRPGMGWLYSPLVEAAAERGNAQQGNGTANPPANTSADIDADVDMVPAISGSGVVIGSQLILTSCSVVDDDVLGKVHSVRVERTREGKIETFVGRIRTISERDDLALVDVDWDDPPAIVPLAATLKQDPGLRVLAAVPTFTLTGKQTISSATVRMLPQTPERGFASLAVVGESTAGAPIIDAQGALVGLCSSSLLGEIVAQQQTVIPVERIRSWLTSVNEVAMNSSPAIGTVELPAASTVRLTGLYPKGRLGLHDALPAEMRNARSEYEDQACVHCNGLASIRCPAPGCALGGVLTVEVTTRFFETSANGRGSSMTTSANRKKCTVCNAAGRVRCPICSGKSTNPDIR